MKNNYLPPPHYFQKNKKYRFVMVSFSDYSHKYAYLCNDESVKVGDYIYVPVGPENHKRLAEVVQVIHALPKNAPYDIYKIKTIIGTSKRGAPLYDLIKEAMQKGFLPTHFDLESSHWKKNDFSHNHVGVVHHLTSHEYCEFLGKREVILDVKRMLRWVKNARYEEAYALLMDLVHETANYDKMPMNIFGTITTLYFDTEFSEVLESSELAHFVHEYLLKKSPHREGVEFGLLMTVFLPYSEELLEDMKVLMAYEGFTFYGVRGMKRLPSGNRHLFQLAQGAVGEGRIHLIEAMDGDDEDIQEWFLYEGPYNFVGVGHGIRDCFNKSGLVERLRGSVEGHELQAISYLLRLTLGSVPEEELDDMEDLSETLTLYFKHLREVSLGIEEYLACKDVYLSCEERFPEFYELAQEFLSDPNCRATVLRNLWHKEAKWMLEFLNEY